MAQQDDGTVDNIRDLLGFLIGPSVVDVLQHDPEEHEAGEHFVELLFDDGTQLTFMIEDKGFTITRPDEAGPPGPQNL